MRVRRSNSSSPEIPNGVVRGCGTVFFGIFVAVGLSLTAVLLIGMLGTLKGYLWVETPCTIVESHRVEPGPERASNSDGFVIKYRYSVQGQEHTSSRLTNGIAESKDEPVIERLLLEYPLSSRARCYVNPSNPEEAILQRGPLWIFAFIFIPLIFAAVGVGGIIRVWTAGEPRADAISRKATRTGTHLAGALFGLVFTIVGAALLYALTIRPVLRVLAARSWQEVPCEILRSEVRKHSSSKGKPTYSVDITYKYSAQGREHRSDRYHFMVGSTGGYDGKAEIVKRFRPGTTATCFLNPADSTEAVLNRAFQPSMLIGLVGLLFLLVGVGVLFGTFRGVRSGGSQQVPAEPVARDIPSVPQLSSTLANPAVGPAELESASSPVGRALGTLFLAVFWNGITGIFVVMAVNSWLKKKPEIFLSIFITPFVLVGVGLILFFLHSLLGLLNPRIRLAVSSGSVPLGGKLEVRWSFRGRSSRIRRLRITLEGSEKAKYTRGTDNRVDTNVFARVPLVEADNAAQITQGQAQLTVPKDTMHTFSAAHNEILWTLKVEGEIPRFPDVSEEFPIIILPRA